MLTTVRRARIRRALRENPAASLAELARMMGISRATLYRDLGALAREGVLTLNRGVASLNEPGVEEAGFCAMPEPPELTAHRLEHIAEAAAQVIAPNDSLFIGEGLVCSMLAQKITRRQDLKDLVVVTNNFHVALVLFSCVKHLYLIGGQLLQNAENLYTGGTRFFSNVSTILVNKAFASVDGLELQVGVTMQDLSQLNILSQLPTFAASTILLATSDKFEHRSIHQLGPLEVADLIITDDGLDPRVRGSYEALKKPRLIVVESAVIP